MSHVARVNESCHTYDHAHFNESCQWVMLHTYMSYATRINKFNKDKWFVEWLVQTCDRMNKFYEDSWYVTRLIYTCATTCFYMWHDSCMSVIWLIHMCDVTYLYVRYDVFIRVKWLIHTCSTTHKFIHAARLCHMCDMTYSVFLMGTVALYRGCSTGLR